MIRTNNKLLTTVSWARNNLPMASIYNIGILEHYHELVFKLAKRNFVPGRINYLSDLTGIYYEGQFVGLLEKQKAG